MKVRTALIPAPVACRRCSYPLSFWWRFFGASSIFRSLTTICLGISASGKLAGSLADRLPPRPAA